MLQVYTPVKSNTNANTWDGEPRHFSIKALDWQKREIWLLCFTPQDELWQLRWEGKGSGNFNEGNSQLLASSKPVKLTRMKISKFGKMYSFLGIFNSMRIQHFCSTAIYQKRLISPVRGRRRNCVEEEGNLGIWISAHSSKKLCNLKTGSLNSVSNFLCHKRKYSHETCSTFLKSK